MNTEKNLTELNKRINNANILKRRMCATKKVEDLQKYMRILLLLKTDIKHLGFFYDLADLKEKVVQEELKCYSIMIEYSKKVEEKFFKNLERENKEPKFCE